jgi:hypothetical protein
MARTFFDFAEQRAINWGGGCALVAACRKRCEHKDSEKVLELHHDLQSDSESLVAVSGPVVGRASTAASKGGVYYGVGQAAGPRATGAIVIMYGIAP